MRPSNVLEIRVFCGILMFPYFVIEFFNGNIQRRQIRSESILPMPKIELISLLSPHKIQRSLHLVKFQVVLKERIVCHVVLTTSHIRSTHKQWSMLLEVISEYICTKISFRVTNGPVNLWKLYRRHLRTDKFVTPAIISHLSNKLGWHLRYWLFATRKSR